MGTRHRFTPEFKARVVLELISGVKTVAEACRECQLKPQLLARGKGVFLDKVPGIFQVDERDDNAWARIAELERMVGRLNPELEVAKKAFSLFNGPLCRSEGWL